MQQVVLGKTKITVNKNGFGCLPIQRISSEAAAHLLRKAFAAGIDFFDTARAYSDSEEKMGFALRDVRAKIILASKTMAQAADGFWSDLQTSLEFLQTEYLDIYQFHNPAFCPRPGDGSGLYEAMLEAKRQGKIRFIGITNHRLHVAEEAVLSGLYDTLQFPFSYLATEDEEALVQLCGQKDMGLIAMKALAGGLITAAAPAYAYLAQYPHVLPIWGIQRERELDEFLRFAEEPPCMDEATRREISEQRQALQGNFCRGCGYCMPCPAGIEIPTCARMSLLIRRAPSDKQLTEDAKMMMKKIEACVHCNKCREKCPYQLDTPALLAENWRDYQEIVAGKSVV